MIAVGLAGIAATAQAQATDDGRFELPADPDQVVVQFVERFGELESSDYPTLRVHADGRVVRHRPAYMVRQGDFTGRLSRQELQELLGSLSDNGLLDFDEQSVRRATSEARQSRVLQSMMTDPSTIEIEIRLAGYRHEKSAAPRVDVHEVVRWTGLRYDAMTYPEVTPVQKLSEAYRQLNALAERVESSGVRQGGAR